MLDKYLGRQLPPAFGAHGCWIGGFENLRVESRLLGNAKLYDAILAERDIQHQGAVIEKVGFKFLKRPCSFAGPNVTREVTTCHRAANLVPVNRTTTHCAHE